ncbi:transcriptional regulator, TetR family [Desulfotignum phosphitoxidans DSM 13687]|uniref:Transcriptional regulator, TetR family n=2 Tax=Desulfotignum phosphitoxidans TaxID=190898 RepID=S0FRQ8_9BACT|nr:transcriptional regulator, TetR family [Desulfotignum phosphitoxidans DSM 13687]
MSARKTDTQQRQEQITQAALDLINDQGVSGLSIAGIARRVGIVPSALYRHFASKDAVLDAVLDLIRQRLLDNVAHVREQTDVPLEQLRLLLIRHAFLLDENRAIPSVVFSEAVYTGAPERKSRVTSIITDYLKEIQAIIALGQQDGSIHKKIEPATAAVLFMGMILPAAILSNISEGLFDITAHVKNVWPAFVRSVSTKTEQGQI